MVALTSPIPDAPLGDGYGARDPIATGGGTSGSFHYGQDFPAAGGTPIRAAAAGVVQRAGWLGTFGNAVYIEHGDGLVTRYAHMLATPPVGVGWHVEGGDVIGFVGTTGASTGNHLHFEVVIDGDRVDPLKHLTRAGGAPSAPKRKRRKIMAACVATPKGATNDVRVFDLATGAEHTFESPDKSYIKNVALTYGVAPDVPVSYITRSHFDKIGAELAATRDRLAAR